jgi:hypothetical protein
MKKMFSLLLMALLFSQHLFAQKPCSVTFSTTSVFICESQLPYIWNGNAYNAAGSYNVSLAGSGGCDSIATLILQVGASSVSFTDTAICSSELPYFWNGESINTSGQYTDTVPNAMGCDSIVNLILTVIASPSSPIVNSTVRYQQYALASALTAVAVAGDTLLWYNAPGGGTGSTIAPIPSTAIPGRTAYYVSQKTAYCESPRAMITVLVTAPPLCAPIGNTTFISYLTGSNYQWQLSLDSIHFTDISNNANYNNVNGDTLQLSNIPSSWYGYQYRCTVDGNSTNPFTLTFADTWTGAVDSTWEKGANWSCGTVPDINTDVIINSNGPVVLSSNTAIRSLTISPAIHFTVNAGYNLTVAH